jgi:intracellular multiplication protein IcmP
MSLLTEARKSGVVAPVEFSWIKGEDRVLWYCLHSVGRKTPFVEGAGAFAHWEVERLVQRPLTRPEVHAAVEALLAALDLRADGDEGNLRSGAR